MLCEILLIQVSDNLRLHLWHYIILYYMALFSLTCTDIFFSPFLTSVFQNRFCNTHIANLAQEIRNVF